MWKIFDDCKILNKRTYDINGIDFIKPLRCSIIEIISLNTYCRFCDKVEFENL